MKCQVYPQDSGTSSTRRNKQRKQENINGNSESKTKQVKSRLQPLTPIYNPRKY